MAININNNGVKNNTIDTKQTRRQAATDKSSASDVSAKSGSDSVSLTAEAQNLSALQEKALTKQKSTALKQPSRTVHIKSTSTVLLQNWLSLKAIYLAALSTQIKTLNPRIGIYDAHH